MLIFLLLGCISGSTVCPLYRCSPSYLFLTPDTCIFFDSSRFTPAYNIQPCKDPSLPYCLYVENQNSTCVESPSNVDKKYPGEKCKQSSDCLSSICSSQTCEGKPEHSSCSSTSQCNPGLYCKSTSCSKQKPEGSSCSSDEECISNYACHYSICTKNWSIETNQNIQICSNNGENFLCVTGKCEGSKCSDIKKNLNSPSLCRKDKDCPSKCDCGINKNANMFCRLEAGDEPYAEYLALLKELSDSGSMQLCNAQRQFTFECAADRWDLSKALRIKYLKYYIHNYAKIVEFDECSHQLFIPEYTTEELITFDSSQVLIIFTIFIIT